MEKFIDTPHLSPDLAAPPVPEIPRSGVFVALSRFTIANDMAAEVREAFRTRPHLVDSEPGFIAMQVMSPVDNPQEIWLVTHWNEEVNYRAWHHGHGYRDAHAGIPKGLKLVPNTTEIRFFDLFAH